MKKRKSKISTTSPKRSQSRGVKREDNLKLILIIILILAILAIIIFLLRPYFSGEAVRGMDRGSFEEPVGEQVEETIAEKDTKSYYTLSTKDGFKYDMGKMIGKDIDEIDLLSMSLPEINEDGNVYLGYRDSGENKLVEKKIRVKEGYIVQLDEDPAIQFGIKKGALSKSLVTDYRKILLEEQDRVESEIKSIAPKAKVTSRYQNVFNGFDVKDISDDEASRIKTISGVKKVYPNYKVHTTLMDAAGLVGAESLWQISIGNETLNGEGITIAILDTGVDYTHPDLGGCFGSYESFIDNGPSIPYNLESPHPLPQNYFNIDVVNQSGLDNIAVHFEYIELKNYEYLYIKDTDQNTIETFSGPGLYEDVWSRPVIGDTLLIQTQSLSGSNDTGNGFVVDSVIDRSIITMSCKVVNGWDFYNNDNDPIDDHFHGTHVASTAAGSGVLNGIAPEASIYAYKVLSSGGGGWFSDIINAIERSTDPNQDNDTSDHVDIISMSLGANCWNYDEYCGPDDPLSQAVDNAVDLGIITVISAGNSGPWAGSIGSPGTARKAITVGATYKKDYVGEYWDDIDPRVDQITSFSSRGPVVVGNETIAKPDIVAPGAIICAARYDSVFPEGSHPYYYPCFDEEHVQLAGTSMSAPIVSGAIALLKQRNPEYTPQQIKDTIKSFAVDLEYDSYTQGAGRIDILSAAGQDVIALIDPYSKTLNIIPTQKHVTKTESFDLKNLISEDLIFSLSIENPYPGIEVNLSHTTINLLAGSTKTFDVIVTVDNDQLASNVYYKIYVKASSGDYKLKIPIKVYIEDRLTSDQEEIDMGLNLPTNDYWIKDFNVQLTNIREDISQDYNVTLEINSWKHYYGSFYWVDEELDISHFFSLSNENLNFEPAETKTLHVSANVINNETPNGIYSGKITLTSGLDSLEIPFSFAKYYEFILAHNDHGNDSIIFASLSKEKEYLGLHRSFNGQFPVKFYIRHPGPYDLVIFGFRITNGYLDTLDIVETDIEINDSLTYVADFDQASNDMYFEMVDKDGNPFNPNSGILTLSNEYLDFTGTWYSGDPRYGEIIRMFSDLPENYYYQYIFGNICTDSDVYSISKRVYGLNSDFVIENDPYNYALVKVYYNSPLWKEVIPLHSLRNGGAGAHCYVSSNIINSGDFQNLYLENKESASGCFNDEEILNAEENPSEFFYHEEGHRSPLLEVINNKLRKVAYDDWEGVLLEETEGKDVYVGIGPDFWLGKIYSDFWIYEGFAKIETKEDITWQWYFMTQGFDIYTHEDMPYSILDDQGNVVEEGLLYGGHLWGTPFVHYLFLYSNGTHTFNLERDYVIENKTYIGKVDVTFNPHPEGGYAPYLDSLKVLCDGVPCDVLRDSNQNKITFIPKDDSGNLIQVKLSYLSGEGWIELPGNFVGEKYEVGVPGFKGDTTFKILLEDDLNNKLEYEFSLPSEGGVICGDVNGDDQVSVSDIVYLINYLYKLGPEPQCSPHTACADTNGDGKVSVSDIVYLVAYLYKQGPAPICS